MPAKVPILFTSIVECGHFLCIDTKIVQFGLTVKRGSVNNSFCHDHLAKVSTPLIQFNRAHSPSDDSSSAAMTPTIMLYIRVRRKCFHYSCESNLKFEFRTEKSTRLTEPFIPLFMKMNWPSSDLVRTLECAASFIRSLF